jgi:DNA-binding IscR family transcriptional regulator
MNFSKTTAYTLTTLNYMAGNQGEVISDKKLHKEQIYIMLPLGNN